MSTPTTPPTPAHGGQNVLLEPHTPAKCLLSSTVVADAVTGAYLTAHPGHAVVIVGVACSGPAPSPLSS
ncbi:hypothetical protein, partial [Corynebacterium pacaense]|uniref:hypothetical protein n=1 Tax=Corynebacterium pacaense TaxID=1816684 RepID=UPI003CCBF395